MIDMATHHKLVLVDVLDPETQEETGRSVCVEVFYVVEGPYTYGADADDRRGESGCFDITALEVYCNPAAVSGLTEDQIISVKDRARQLIEEGRL